MSNGHKMMIDLMVETCRKFVRPSPSVIHNNVASSLTDKHSDDYETLEQPVEDDGTSFFNYIGSLKISIFGWLVMALSARSSGKVTQL